MCNTLAPAELRSPMRWGEQGLVGIIDSHGKPGASGDSRKGSGSLECVARKPSTDPGGFPRSKPRHSESWWCGSPSSDSPPSGFPRSKPRQPDLTKADLVKAFLTKANLGQAILVGVD